MPIGRRLATLLVILALVGAPAVVLRIFCIGSSCETGDAGARAAVPFCSLPHALRRSIVAGFREGRSPDVMASTSRLDAVRTEVAPGVGVAWPGGTADQGNAAPDDRVPIAFLGGGVRATAVMDDARLDAIAPTLEAITGLRRDHPEVRTGEPIVSIADGGHDVPLVVLIAWKGVGTADLEGAPGAWPFLRRALRDGSGTLAGSVGSLPLDPTATLTTIGTGGLPSAHGITGTLVRDDRGDVRRAWSDPGTGSVIATFADDLDHDTGGRADVAAILTDPADRGLIGDGWYLDGVDRDDVVEIVRPTAAARAARRLMSDGTLGEDDVPDVLGVVLEGSIREVDRATAEVVAVVDAYVPTSTVVIAGTGAVRGPRGVDASEIALEVEASVAAPVVDAPASDGLFLDRTVLVERSLTTQRVADALRAVGGPGGPSLFADVYPSFAVAFARYC